MKPSLARDLAGSLRQPEFWGYSSWLDLTVKYRRTQLGILWILVAFFLFVAVMGFKFGYLMNLDPHAFLPYVGAGYMAWRFLVMVVNDSSSTFYTHRAYIMDGRMRLTDYVLRSLVNASVNFVFAAVVMVFVLIWSGRYQISGLFTLFLTFPLLLINAMWMGLCVGFVGARFADTREIIGTALMAGFLLTPIIWDVASYPPGTLRGDLTRLNPAFHLIQMVREPILGRMPEISSMVWVGAMAVIGWALMAVIYRRCARYVPLWV